MISQIRSEYEQQASVIRLKLLRGKIKLPKAKQALKELATATLTKMNCEQIEFQNRLLSKRVDRDVPLLDESEDDEDG